MRRRSRRLERTGRFFRYRAVSASGAVRDYRFAGLPRNLRVAFESAGEAIGTPPSMMSTPQGIERPREFQLDCVPSRIREPAPGPKGGVENEDAFRSFAHESQL